MLRLLWQLSVDECLEMAPLRAQSRFEVRFRVSWLRRGDLMFSDLRVANPRTFWIWGFGISGFGVKAPLGLGFRALGFRDLGF